MFKVQGSKVFGVTRDNRYTLHHHIITSSHHLIITSILLFSLTFGFAQGLQSPKDSPRFVYPTSVALSYGLGNNYNGFTTFPNQNLSVEIQQVIAYQFNNYFFTGMGAGLDFWIYNKKLSTFIPMFANITAKLMDKKTSPFVFANVGYAFKWHTTKKNDEDFFYGSKNGIHFQGGLGLNLKFSEKISLLFSAYYKMQQSAVQYRENEFLFPETKNQLFHFVGIKIGVLY